VSGHASQEDLKLMLNLTRPRFFIPVHGEYRHLLGHARLARSTGLADDRVFLVEDGVGIEVTKTSARVVGRYPVGRVLVDGKGIGDIGTVVLRDRQILAQDGLVAVAVVLDRTGRLVAGPDIGTRGFVHVRESEALLDELKAAVVEALANRPSDLPTEPEAMRESIGALIRASVRQFINRRFQRKPVVLPILLEV
jgi:ribonuclease J